MPVLYLVIPCYNEEEVLPVTASLLLEKLEGLIAAHTISSQSRILFVDDGSKDKTWQIISALVQEGKRVCGVKLSRNFGHQNALLAGLMRAKEHCDITISMDADLQDDPAVIDTMLQLYSEGNEIVYGVREDRASDSWFKRNSAQLFYGVMRTVSKNAIANHADCRLMSKRALAHLGDYTEVNLFLREMVPQIGLKNAVAYYARKERFAGESKYPLKKMLSFALEGITSHSIRPLRFLLVFSVVNFLVNALLFAAFLVCYWTGVLVSALAVTVFAIFTTGSVLLVAISLIGEYVGKTYQETKKRPRFIVETELHPAQ